MTVRMKRGVFLNGDHPCLFEIIDAAKLAYYSLGYDVVITSGREGTHSKKSLHYQGRALDLRTRMLDDTERAEIQLALHAKLGDDYDVVFERDHLHVEYDPR